MSSSVRRLTAIVLLAGIAAGGYFLWTSGQLDRLVASVSQTRAPAPVAPPAAPPPPEVGVVEVRVEDVALPVQYAGRVAGFRVVEVRAQIGGILLKREVPEGAAVAVGDVLFRIDPRPYEAALQRSQAQEAQAQASLRLAEENFTRIEQLVQRQTATPKQLDDATAARDQTRAALQAAQADVATARLNLEYTVVRAPVAGPTSLGMPPEGTLVQAQQTLLTTITQLDPAYVNYSTTDREFREFQEMDRLRAAPLVWEDLAVRLQFGDGAVYGQPGRLDTRSRTVDPRTGTIQIRAVFPNAGGELLPGQFVRVNVEGVTMPRAVKIPKRAINQGPQGPFVYVVDGQSNAQVRPVRLDRELNDGWVLREGLQAGERLIVDGVIRVRPGGAVRPVPYEPRPAGAATAAAGARP